MASGSKPLLCDPLQLERDLHGVLDQFVGEQLDLADLGAVIGALMPDPPDDHCYRMWGCRTCSAVFEMNERGPTGYGGHVRWGSFRKGARFGDTCEAELELCPDDVQSAHQLAGFQAAHDVWQGYL